jgi:hypothetical protein
MRVAPETTAARAVPRAAGRVLSTTEETIFPQPVPVAFSETPMARTRDDDWQERRRRLAEWQRLHPDHRREILAALHGVRHRPSQTQLEMRLAQRRL